MPPPLLESHIPGSPCRRGKVRDVYDLGDRLVIVATDRISAFDWVLPTGIPDKGRVLTQMSPFWFDFLGEPNHLLTTDLGEMGPAFAARAEAWTAARCWSARPRWCRSSAWCAATCPARAGRSIAAGGTVCGIALPPGLRESDRLPEPIFTPATKAESGHDENISFERMVEISRPRAVADELRRRSLDVYRRAADYARSAASSSPTRSSNGASCRTASSS